MIQDSQCNKVYLSEYLPETCPITYANLTAILNAHGVGWSLLHGTRDIWCRDFMPIQLEDNRFATYRYYPDYLNTRRNRPFITDWRKVVESPKCAEPFPLDDIIIDGGNVVRCGDKIVMTTKVFEENPSNRVSKLADLLEQAFGAEVIFIPWDSHEEYGHADGVCRYVGNNTLLLTNYRQFDEKMAIRFINCLKPHFKQVIELSYKVETPNPYNWAYINWLQTDRLIVVPTFGCDEDEQAVEQIRAVVPYASECVVACRCDDLVPHGGALNCCTWTVKE